MAGCGLQRSQAWTNAGPRLDSVVAAATPMLERAIETYRAADTTWEEAKFTGESATLRQQVARVWRRARLR